MKLRVHTAHRLGHCGSENEGSLIPVGEITHLNQGDVARFTCERCGGWRGTHPDPAYCEEVPETFDAMEFLTTTP